MNKIFYQLLIGTLWFATHLLGSDPGAFFAAQAAAAPVGGSSSSSSISQTSATSNPVSDLAGKIKNAVDAASRDSLSTQLDRTLLGVDPSLIIDALKELQRSHDSKILTFWTNNRVRNAQEVNSLLLIACYHGAGEKFLYLARNYPTAFTFQQADADFVTMTETGLHNDTKTNLLRLISSQTGSVAALAATAAASGASFNSASSGSSSSVQAFRTHQSSSSSYSAHIPLDHDTEQAVDWIKNTFNNEHSSSLQQAFTLLSPNTIEPAIKHLQRDGYNEILRLATNSKRSDALEQFEWFCKNYRPFIVITQSDVSYLAGANTWQNLLRKYDLLPQASSQGHASHAPFAAASSSSRGSFGTSQQPPRLALATDSTEDSDAERSNLNSDGTQKSFFSMKNLLLAAGVAGIIFAVYKNVAHAQEEEKELAAQ